LPTLFFVSKWLFLVDDLSQIDLFGRLAYLLLVSLKNIFMNFNNFTIKAQEAIQHAFEIAQGHTHQAVETGHILKGILSESEGVSGFLFKKLGVNLSMLEVVLNKIVESYPKVSGGEQYVSSSTNRALQKAQDSATEMGDQYISVEHLMVGLVEVGDPISQMLKDAGVSIDELKKAIAELRKGSTVTSQTAEDTFDSLNRFAVNLNERAKMGKLDPVIGRDEEIRRVLQILSRRTKNNPILVGEAGVGKTAIVEGIAHRIVNGDVPENLKNRQIYSLDMGH